MTDEKAWYLIAKDLDNNNLPVAMVHFRFDIDNDDEVLYWLADDYVLSTNYCMLMFWMCVNSLL